MKMPTGSVEIIKKRRENGAAAHFAARTCDYGDGRGCGLDGMVFSVFPENGLQFRFHLGSFAFYQLPVASCHLPEVPCQPLYCGFKSPRKVAHLSRFRSPLSFGLQITH